MGSQRVAALRDELIRTAKSLKGVGVLLGGGLVPFILYIVPAFGLIPKGNPVLVGMLVFLGMLFPLSLVLAWNLSRYAEDRYWFDRKYVLITQKWAYSPNQDLQTLRAECVGERKVVCLADTLEHLNISVAPAENLVPFDPTGQYIVELDPQSRHPNGNIALREPHRKEGASFSFRVDFYPPLKEGEEAYVKFRFVLPRFKISTLDYLRERCRTAKLEARDYEFGAWTIGFPTDRFRWELRFSPECRIKPRAPEALRGTAVLNSEQSELRKNGAFSAEQLDGGWRLVLDRRKPPMRTRYRISWNPPSNGELASALAGQGAEH